MSTDASTIALAKLEPYLLLAKSARGAAAAKLITEATAAPGCFVFSELLDFDGIRQLAQDEKHAAHYRLLELFAYGTMTEYNAAPAGTYPALADAHIAKLRLLTLASLAASSRNLAYSTLVSNLGLGSEQTMTAGQASASTSTAPAPVQRIRPRAMRQLEDIVIEAIYSGILSARIDQQRQRLEVESVMGRDVLPEHGVASMAKALDEWSATTTNVLETLAARIDDAKRKEQQRGAGQAEQDAELERVLSALLSNQGNAGSGTGNGTAGGGNARQHYDRMGSDRNGDMDLDDDGTALRKKKSSSGGPLRSKRSRA